MATRSRPRRLIANGVVLRPLRKRREAESSRSVDAPLKVSLLNYVLLSASCKLQGDTTSAAPLFPPPLSLAGYCSKGISNPCIGYSNAADYAFLVTSALRNSAAVPSAPVSVIVKQERAFQFPNEGTPRKQRQPSPGNKLPPPPPRARAESSANKIAKPSGA